MPRDIPSQQDLTTLCVVRCSGCSRVLQPYMTRFRYWCRQGRSIADALTLCGVDDCSVFLTVEEEKNCPTPPPICCRNILTTALDLTNDHSRYKHAIAWAEGPTAVGLPKAMVSAGPQSGLPAASGLASGPFSAGSATSPLDMPKPKTVVSPSKSITFQMPTVAK